MSKRLLTVLGGGRKPWYLTAGVTPIAAYQAIGATSYAASKVNLANHGTHDLVEGIQPGWAKASGWASTGTEYLLMGIAANIVTYSVIVRFSDAEAVDGKLMFGSNEGGVGKRFGFGVYAAGIRYRYINYDTTIAPVITSGTLAISNLKGYRNGAVESFTATAAAYTTGNLALLGYWNGVGLDNGYIGKIQAAAVYDQALTPAQVLLLHTNMMLLDENTAPF